MRKKVPLYIYIGKDIIISEQYYIVDGISYHKDWYDLILVDTEAFTTA